jgi:spore maturation protein CgeB
MNKVYIVGQFNEKGLEYSYKTALEEEGIAVKIFNYPPVLQRHIRFGKIGRLFTQFVPVEQWVQKLNKQIAMDIVRYEPDTILIFTNAPMQAGSLAFIKSLSPARIILVWPDTLCNLTHYPILAKELYDGVASHGQATLPVLKQMGFKNPFWLPFAADKDLHYFETPPANFEHDVSFIGSWNKEREDALAAVYKKFPGRRLAIYGPGWDRAKESGLNKKAISKPLIGKEYAAVFNRSFINLNVIGGIAYPSVNMRFFEIPVAYGLQVVNYSPEQAPLFEDHRHLAYFKTDEEMLQKVDFFLTHPDKAMEVRKEAHALVCTQHTYRHRVQTLRQQVKAMS